MKKWLALIFLTAAAFGQQTNSDIVPASPGLNIGHSNQRWNGFFNNINITGTCTVNGVVTSCFGGGGGSGTLTGITTAAGSGLQGGGTSGTLSLKLLQCVSIGQILAWNGTGYGCSNAGTGDVTQAGNNLFTGTNFFNNAGSFTGGAMHQYNSTSIGGCNSQTEYQVPSGGSGYEAEAVTGCMTGPTSFGGPGFMQAVAGAFYAVGRAPGIQVPTIAVQGIARSTVSNTSVHGGSFVVSDGGAGVPNNDYFGIENYMIVNTGNTASSPVGMLVNGTFSAQPTTAVGYQLDQPAGGNHWPWGFRFEQGATPAVNNSQAALYFAPLNGSANADSQGILFNANDPTSGNNTVTVNETAAGNLLLTSSKASTGLSINGGQGLATTNQTGYGNLCMTAGCAPLSSVPNGHVYVWSLPTGNTLSKSTVTLTLTQCVVTGTNLATCTVNNSGNPSATTIMNGLPVTISGFTSTGAFLNATYASLTYISATSFSVSGSGWTNNTYSAGSPSASATSGTINTPAWVTGTTYYQLNWVQNGGNYYKAVSGGLTSKCTVGNQQLNCAVSGASAPTCNTTIGVTTCSDGQVVWTYEGPTSSTSNAGAEPLDELSVYVWTSPLISGFARSLLWGNTQGLSNTGWIDQSGTSATGPSVSFSATANPDFTTRFNQPNFPGTDKAAVIFSHVLGSTGASSGINTATPSYVFTQTYANTIKNSWAASTIYLPWQYIWDGTHFQYITNAGHCTSGTSTPSWNHAGSTTTEGAGSPACVWQDNGTTNAPAQHVTGGCNTYGDPTMAGLTSGIYSVTAANSTGSAAQAVADLVTGFPVTWETPYLTAWKLTTAQAVANFNATYPGRIAYMRVALGAGGENFAWCNSQLKIAAGGSTAGVPNASGTTPNFQDVWESALNNQAFPYLASLQSTSGFPLMSSFNGGQNAVQSIAVADVMAQGLAANRIGAGSQGLVASDATAYPTCAQDACSISNYLRGQVPFNQGQTAGVTDPTGTNAPGTLNTLLPFWGTWLDTFEPFVQDVFTGFNPNWSSYPTYGTQYYSTFQNFAAGSRRNIPAVMDPTYHFSGISVNPVPSAIDGIAITPAASANPATVNISATSYGFTPDSNVNLNLVSLGTGSVLCNGVACGGGGFTNPMTTVGDMLIGGTAGTATRLAGPIATNGVPQILTSTPSGGAATAQAWSPAGVPTNAQTGTTYSIAATDRASYISFSNASPIAVTLPQAGTTGFANNFVFVACDIGAGTATITPTTSTISYTNGSSYSAAQTTLALATGQCAWVYSDNANYFAIQRTGGAGSGTVTSVGLAGTANQITITGSSPITTSGSWTASVPADFRLGTDSSTAGTVTLANSAAAAHTIFSSGATTTNTIQGFATVPTTGHLIDCTVTTTTCLLHDSGVITANVVNASAPGAGIAHFAGSTQTVTSSLIVAADITAATITGAKMVNNTVTATQLAAQYSKGSCTEVWGGSGTAFAMTAGDDAISNNSCYNDSGVTRTITAVKCRSDNAANTTTVNPTFGSAGTGTTILSGVLTCGNSYAYSSTGTVSNASWTTGTGIDPGMTTVGNATSIAVIVEYTF